jgi:hypothetical protein
MDYILNWLFNKNIIKKNYVGNDTTVFLYYNLSLNNLHKQTKNLFCVFVLPFYLSNIYSWACRSAIKCPCWID